MVAHWSHQMDKLKQVGKILHQTRQDTDKALLRIYKDQPLIEQARDIFDSDNAFELNFETSKSPKRVEVSLKFKPIESLICPPSEGCFQGRCDFYYNGTDTVLTTTYEFVSGTSYVYVNDLIVSHTETGANEVTISSRNITDSIRVCYIYQSCEYGECVTGDFDLFLDHFDRTASDWGDSPLTPTPGAWNWETDANWDEDYTPGEWSTYTDGDRAHLEIEAVNPLTQIFMELDVSTAVGGRLSTKDFVEVYWDVQYHTEGTFYISGVVGHLIPPPGGFHRYSQWVYDINSGGFTWLNRQLGNFVGISGFNYGLNERFFVAIRVEATGGHYFKSWSASDPEPEWFTHNLLTPALFSPSEINWFLIEGRSSDGSNPGGTPGPSSGTTHISLGFIKLRYCRNLGG